MANNQIKIGVGFQVDKTGLNELQNSLKQIQISASQSTGTNKMTQSLKEAASTAKIVDEALEKAFNVNLGTTNLSKFNQELKKNNLTIDQVRTKFSQAGQAGEKAWNLLGSQILKTNIQLKESNKLLDEMATSMANTVKWGITSSIFNTITQSISKAYTYTKKLDGSLNDIRIVTDKSAESMEKFAKQANEAAKGLGSSTLDYTEASLIYYQQGLSDVEVQARTETTLKAANVTGQHADEVSEQLTAVWNGYKVSAQEAELYVDKLAAVATGTAADLEELSTGMSKVASAANSMGVDIDQLNAQLATIVSVTRQAPESVGTALKTIYARISDLKLGGTDEDGLGLGDVSGTLESMGIQILDATGNLREIGDVIEEVAVKWDTWTEAQKTAIAQVMAGKRQYNNLVALFENWDMYTDALNMSAEAAGTLQKQQDIYMESTDAHLQQLRTTAEDLYDGLFDTEEINTFIDLLTDLTQVGSNFVNSFGGGFKSIGGILMIVANIFNKQLSKGISNLIVNQQKMISNAELLRQKAEQLKAVSQNQVNLNTIEGVKAAAIAEGYQKQAEYAQKLQDIQHNLSQEEYNRLNTLTAEVGELTEQITLLERTAQFVAGEDINKDKVKQVFEGEESFEDDIANTSNQLEIENQKLTAAKELDTVYGEIKKQISTINEENLYDLELTQKQQKYISNIIKAKNDGHISEEEANRKIQKYLNKQQKINQDNIKLHQKKIKQLETEKNKMQQIQEMAGEAQRLDAERKVQESDLDEGLEVGQQSAKVLEGVTKVTSALSTMAMSWMSINSLMDTWGDKSLSTGQKISQTLMTVGMTLPMIISSFKSLNEAMGIQTGLWTGLKSSVAVFNAQRAAGIPIGTALLGLTKAENIEKVHETIVDKARIKMAALNNLTTETSILLLQQESKEKLIEIGLTEAEIVALQKAKVAQDALNTSMLASSWTWVVLGLAAVVGAIALYNKVTLTAEERAEKAAEQQRQLQEAYQATAEKYNNLINSVKQYEQAKDALNKLTQGTDEWKDSVFALNQQVLELIQTYPELGALVKDINGQLVLDTESQDYKEYIEKLKKQQQAAYRINLKGTEKKNQTEIDSGVDNVKIRYTISGGNNIPTSSAIGSNQTIENTKLVSNQAKEYAIKGLTENNAIANDKNAFIEYMNKEYKANQNLIEALWAAKDELILLSNEMHLNTESNELLASQRYNSKYEGTFVNGEKFEDYKYRNLIVEAAKNKEQSKEIQDFEKIQTQRVTNLSKVDKKAEYQALTGISDEAYANLDDDTIISGLVASAVEDKVLEIFDEENFAKEIEKIETDDIGKKLLGALNLNELETNPDEVAKLLGLNYTTISTIFNDEKYKHIFNTMGYESATELLNAYNTKLNEYDATAYWDNQANQIKSKLNTLNESISKLYKNEELSEEDYAALEQQFTELTKIKDRDSDAYLDALQEIREAHEETYGENLVNSIESSYEKANEALEKYKNSVERLNKNFPDFGGPNRLEVETQLEQLEQLEIALENIYSKEYELQIAEVDSILTDADNLINLADDIQVALESIGDGFQVAADKSEALFKVFPELALNAQVTANGIIQLDSQIAESVIGNDNDIINNNKKVLTEKIKNKIEELKVELKTVETELETINNLQEHEYKAYIEKMNLTTTAGDTQSKISAQTAEDQVANDGAATTEVVKNWIEKEKAAIHYGKIAASIMSDPKNSYLVSMATVEDYGISTEVTTQNTISDEDMQKQIEQQYADIINDRKEYLANQKDLLITEIADLTTAWGNINFETTKGYKEAIDKNKKDDGSKNKKEEKKAQDEIDRYWELNKAIENVEEALSDLDKQQEKLYGKEKINSLREENKLLAQQADAYRALAEEQRKEAGELQGVLSNYGVVFDAQGAVANYLEATQAMLNQYNAAVAAYNAGLIDEATFGVTEKAYENFKATLERYETLYYNEMRETQNKLDEIHRQELENNLEAWEIEIQLKLDMKELKRQWNDFFKEINENFKLVYEDLGATMNNLVKNSKTYVGKDGDIATIRKAISDVTKEIDKMRSGGSSDMFESISQAQEKLKELNTDLQDSARGLRDLWEEAWDTYLEGIDQAADKFEDIMEQYERANEEIEYQKELIELLYGDEAYDLMAEYYDVQLENTLAQADSLKQQADMWKKQYEAAKAIDEQNGTTSEDTKKFYENWQKAQQGVNDKVKEYIKLLQDDYKNTVDKILNDLEKKLTGGHGLSEMREQWELLQKQAEGYYDDVEKVYQLSTLDNKYEKAIASASGKHQKQLQAMREKEMKHLKEKKKLSEYDIKIANARYDMTLKQIALEEARQNKNSMTLVRGADGNWNYQYVANKEDIAQKEQDLLDSSDNYYQVSKDGDNDYREKWISSLEDYIRRRAEIEDKYKHDEEGRVRALAELEEIYNGKDGIFTNLAADAENIKINLADATLQSILNNYKVNLDSYEYMTTQEQELLKGLENGTIVSYDEMLNKATAISQSTLNVWQSMVAQVADLWYKNPDSVKQEILLSYDKIQEANDNYKQAISDLEESAGQDFGEDGIKGSINDAKKATNILEGETKKLVQTAERELPKYREQVNKIEQAWYGVKNGIQSSINTIKEYLNYVGETKKAAEDMAISMQKAASAIRDATAAQKALNNAKTYVNNNTTDSNSGYYYIYTGKTDGGQKLYSLYDSTGKSIWLSKPLESILHHPVYSSAVDKSVIKGFSSGGYTGEWNNGDTDGRLAWLHQKELVLNAADTENILSVVDTVRDLTKIGSSIESSIMNNISKMLFNLMNLGSYGQSYEPQLVTATEDITENIFHINAEFPNANDVSSIREAILNLPNIASQYIARNKR